MSVLEKTGVIGRRLLVPAMALLLPALAGSPSARAGERPRLVAQMGHKGGAGVVGVEFSPDGRLLLSAGRGGVAILWDAESGREIRGFVVGSRSCRAVFSRDGSRVLARCPGEGARVFATATGEEDGRFRKEGESVLDAELSPGGELLLTGSGDGKVRLWRFGSGEVLWEVQARAAPAVGVDPQPAPAGLVAFSPVGTEIAVAAGIYNKHVVVCDARTGAELRRFPAGNAGTVYDLAFSPDGSRILLRDLAHVTLLDAADGRKVLEIPGDVGNRVAVFSPDGSWLAASSESRQPEEGAPGQADAVIYDAKSGAEVRRIAPASREPRTGTLPSVSSVAFSRDGEWLLTAGFAEPLRLWSFTSGAEVANYAADGGYWTHVSFAPGRRGFVLAGGPGIYLFSPGIGWTRSFTTLALDVSTASLSPDGRELITTTNLVGNHPSAILWPAAGRAREPVWGSSVGAAFSPDVTRILLKEPDGSLRLLDAGTRAEIRRFVPHPTGTSSFVFSLDGRRLLTCGFDAARLWEVDTGREIATIEGEALSGALSPDGTRILTCGPGQTTRVWDAESGTELYAIEPELLLFDSSDMPGGERRTTPDPPMLASFSPDGSRILTASFLTVRTWEAAKGKELLNVPSEPMPWCASFSPGGRSFAVGYGSGAVVLRETEDGSVTRRFEGHRGIVVSLEFSRDGRRLLTGSFDATTRIWDVETGEELLRLIFFMDRSWAVLDREGRYDASHGGEVKGLHWVIGNEPISLVQLKERYYDPGLLGKVLGVNPEPLREVGAFTAPKLFPEVELDPPTAESAKLGIHLRNRGGGLGRVVVKVNGKELTADARGPGLDPDAEEASLSVDLTDDPRLVPGKRNVVEVQAYNAEGYLRSRGLRLAYVPPGERERSAPELWAVVVGVSDYGGEAIDLRFAAKDAEDFAKALELAGNRLFGEERVHLALLTTAGESRPSRSAVVAALRAVSAAKPEDLLVVYLSGHGVSLGGQDGDFHYLTADARSADLSDPAVREQVSLSSRELTDLVKELPPLKQVLVLDTCASGRLVEKLTEKRELPGSRVRAMERMKDRTGLFVLAGCASDRVSYEATRFAQGLLTHSLLMGMKGAALRADEYVDVSRLFGFSADKVPELARDIGGIQRPLIASPKGSSFDIGRLTEEDKAKVPLQAVRPMFLRSSFQHAEEFEDVLGLEKRVDHLLAGMSAKGAEAVLVFVDARDFPDAYRIAGQYVVEDGTAKVRFRLFRGRERSETVTVEGPAGDVAALAHRVVKAAEKLVE